MARRDPKFRDDLTRYSREYVGRPTPLFFCANLTAKLGGAKIYLKREDLCHTGAHKVNNTLGQALLAVRMGKSRITAETGAGQHGVATATMAALFKRECEVFMGSVDVERQSLNVFRMKLLGAKVTPVDAGSKSLKDAMNEALRDWIATVRDTYYLIGTAAGPHPYPMIVRDFQAVIGREARRQIRQARRPAARRAGRVRQWRLERDRPLLSVYQRYRGAHDWSRGGRTGAQRTDACGDDHGRAASACCTVIALTCCRTRWGRFARLIRSRRASTIPASVPNWRGSTKAAAPNIRRRYRRRGARRAATAVGDRGNHPGAGKLARGRATRPSWRRRCRANR